VLSPDCAMTRQAKTDGFAWEESALGVLRRDIASPLLVCRGSIDAVTVELVEQVLEWMGQSESVTVLLSSNGGHVIPAYKMAVLLRQRCADIRMLIPRRARSAATLVAIGADRIAMGEFAELGPLDASIIVQPFANDGVVRLSASDAPYMLRIAKEWSSSGPESVASGLPANAASVSTLVGIYRAEDIVIQLATRLLGSVQDPMPQETIVGVVDRLVHGYVSHDYPIMRPEAQAIGLRIERPSSANESLLRAAENQVAHLSAREHGERAVVIGGNSDCDWKLCQVGD